MRSLGSGLVALSKNEIGNLHGGRVRGEELLVEVTLGPLVRVWVYGRLRNQYWTQRCPKHPEGSEPITADGFARELRYDVATATLELPVPTLVCCSAIGFVVRRYPAKIYRCSELSESAHLRRREARIWKARFQLLRAVRHHGNDAQVIGTLMAEHLGLVWHDHTREPLPSRLIAYAFEIDERAARDLAALVNVGPAAFAVAA